MSNRREWILGVSAALAGARWTGAQHTQSASPTLDADAEWARNPAHPSSALRDSLKLGYASITWDGKDLEAIDEISALGFRGIQLRSNILPQFGARPEALRALLKARHLTLVALSSGVVKLVPADEAATIAEHVRNATFVRDVGGLYLQVTDEKPRGRAPTADDYVRLGKLLTEIGKRTADIGVPLGYHNHMGSMGETPEQVEQILAASDAAYVKFELDIAHYQQGGGNPARAIRDHASRLLFLHIKDVESPVPATDGAPARAYRFVELGRGRVDLPAVFAALRDVKFIGWAVVELDSVPDATRTPREAAEISKRYLTTKLGLVVD